MRGKRAAKSADQAYYEATAKSRAYHKRSLLAHVNGVHHNIRFYEPYPFVAKSASGARIRDIDGNAYADYWMGHWSMILGHAHHEVKKRLQVQLGLGWMHGTSSQNTLELSAIIRRAVRAAERIRYVTSGTEAAMYAVRLARAYTGRKIIAKVDGGWHGYTSDLLKTVNWPYNTKEGRGLVSDRHVISVPYNDLDGTISALKKAGKDLAGIMMEPVLGGGGCIPAERSYMKGVQEYAKKKGALFMLDEIVTGFRFGYGCLHAEMSLDPDIVLLGKIIGGGMPIGAVCGKSEIMEISNTSKNAKTARAYIGGGTFSANPATMAAGAATLNVLRAEKSSIYPRIARLGRMARDGIAQALGPSCTVTGKGSLFMPHFGAGPIRNAADAARCDSKALSRHHFELIAKHRIFFLPGKLGAVSAAHTKEDIEKMIAATESLYKGGQA